MNYQDLGDFAFVGDLSLEDANILARYGKKSKKILEFGVGGSTHIFAQCMPELLMCVETESSWIDKTKERLSFIDDKTDPIFSGFSDYKKDKYDLIFVDGVLDLRRQFACDTWELLNVGGVMIFHDTRRFPEFSDAMWMVQLYFNEVDRIDVNTENSNMTIVFKKYLQPYVNWNELEGKPLWSYGYLDIPEGEGLWKITN